MLAGRSSSASTASALISPGPSTAGALSAAGMTLDPHGVRPVVTPTKPWECHPNCTIEAPEPFFRSGALNLLYSAASTWDGSYVLGLAHGTLVSMANAIARLVNLDPGLFAFSVTGAAQTSDTDLVEQRPAVQRVAPGVCLQT